MTRQGNSGDTLECSWLQWQNPAGIWDGTIWVSGKISPKPKKQAYELVLYVLGELKDSAAVELEKELREIARSENYKLPDRLKIPSFRSKNSL
jgi:hypothetical protein